MKKITLLLLIGSWFAAGIAQAERMQLEMIPLNHGTPQEILPVIEPLVVEGGTVTASGNQLIIKSTPSNIAEIKQILDSIDTAPRRLMITVRQDVDNMENRSRQSLSGNYSEGDVTISGGDHSRRRSGIVIRGEDSEGNTIEYRGRDTLTGSSNHNSHSVQTLEGRPAFIRTGREVPVTDRTTYLYGGTVVQQDSTRFYDATSGFYALPRLSGDRVTLLIAPRLADTGRRGEFDIQEVETTVSGRLGEWIRVGGLDQSVSRSDSGVLSGRQRQHQSQSEILLKVEEVGGNN
ncbi:MAG: secretin N-terminal domain-containing protein [Gammaproteobacteria bacterium]